MPEDIYVKIGQNPRLHVVQYDGQVRCLYTINLIHKDEVVWTKIGNTYEDILNEDMNPAPDDDIYSLNEVFKPRIGVSVLNYEFQIGTIQEKEKYDISISLVQDNKVNILGHFKYTDGGFDTNRLRLETGIFGLLVS